ncbi:11317_t:CDS:2 [Gigaspora rosea]|nr:11317_t:CDS:2 [Gigaspora rosea]
MERSKEEQNRKQYEEWRQDIPSSASIVTVFPPIESLVNRYLRPNVSHFLVEQMKESLYYTASCSTIEEVESLTNRIRLTRSGKYQESQAIGLIISSFFLQTVHMKAQFSLTLIEARWILRDKRLDAAKEDSYSGQRFNKLADNVQESNERQFTWLQLFADNETRNSVNETFVDEVLFYGKVWGLARTAVNKCMLHHDHAFINLIEAYLENVHAIEDDIAEQNTTENVESTIVSIENPRKVVTRGRPKSTSHDKTVATTTQEESSKKRGQYTCGLCKQPGHNIATCSHKDGMGWTTEDWIGAETENTTSRQDEE